MDLLNESVDLARAIGDRVGEGTALMNRGRTALGSTVHRGRWARHHAALAVLSEVGDSAGVAGALLFSGLTPLFTGDVAAGVRQLRQVRRLLRGTRAAHVARSRTATARPRATDGR